MPKSSKISMYVIIIALESLFMATTIGSVLQKEVKPQNINESTLSKKALKKASVSHDISLVSSLMPLKCLD